MDSSYASYLESEQLLRQGDGRAILGLLAVSLLGIVSFGSALLLV